MTQDFAAAFIGSPDQIDPTIVIGASLESANYVPNVSGYRLDYATGDVEFGSGLFRGDVRIGTTVGGGAVQTQIGNNVQSSPSFGGVTFDGPPVAVKLPGIGVPGTTPASSLVISSGARTLLTAAEIFLSDRAGGGTDVPSIRLTAQELKSQSGWLPQSFTGANAFTPTMQFGTSVVVFPGGSQVAGTVSYPTAYAFFAPVPIICNGDTAAFGLAMAVRTFNNSGFAPEIAPVLGPAPGAGTPVRINWIALSVTQ